MVENLSDRVKAYRAENSLSQREFAWLVGISQPTLVAIENNKYSLSSKTVKKIFDFLDGAGDCEKMQVVEKEFINYKSLMDELANLFFERGVKSIKYDFSVNSNDGSVMTILEGVATPQRLLFVLMKRLVTYDVATVLMDCSIPLLFVSKNGEKYMLSYCE